MLTVTNLSIRTKQTKETLVRSVSFSVKSGEALGLIGESGSGKSMTSKCIMRLLNPRLFDLRGSVKWNGKEMLAVKLNELDGYRGKQISMIPQNPMTAFAPMLKLGKQMELGFPLKGRRERTQFRGRLAAALADVNLPDAEKIINSYPHELSGGTLQRVMIALTILQRPELIIADEITTAVDAASEYLILNELEKLRRAGVSMIVVTHDFGVAARLCDRVAVMKAGEIIEEGKCGRYFLLHSTNIPGSLCRQAYSFRRVYAESGTYHKTISDPRRRAYRVRCGFGCLHRAWRWRRVRHRGRERERQEHFSQSAVLCGAAGRWAGVSGWSGGVRLQKNGAPRCKR